MANSSSARPSVVIYTSHLVWLLLSGVQSTSFLDRFTKGWRGGLEICAAGAFDPNNMRASGKRKHKLLA
jgi:hypothetical protein